MKKLLTAILAFTYMGTSIGATMHMHYCRGKFSGWSISITESPSCQTCGMEKVLIKQKGCCTDDQQTIKNTNDQKSAEVAFQSINSMAAALPSSFVDAPSDHIISVTEANPLSNGPPQTSSVAIYIRNRVFRI